MSYNQRIEKKLNKICTITSSKRIYRKEYEKSGIPFYRSKEVIQKHNNEPIDMELFISKERYHEIKTQFGVPKKGDILLTSVGTLGIPYYIDNDEKFYFKDGNLTWFKDFSNEIHSKYLYYYLLSSVGKEKIDQITIGSTQKAITIQGLKSIKILMPSKNVQVLVTKILSSIDDKIKLNNKINNNLEELAQTLYKHWFVDFEFPNEEGLPYKSSGGKMVESELGLIPEGWNVKTISDITTFNKRGYAPSYTENDEPTGIPVINQRCVRNHTIIEEAVRYHDNNIKTAPDDRYHNKWDVLVNSMGVGTLGRVAVSSIQHNKIVHSVITILRPSTNKILNGIFAYAMLSFEDLFTSMGTGSTGQTSLSNKYLGETKIVLAPLLIQKKLNKTLENIQIKIDKNHLENNKLINLRDLLLPKLMSGEIRVPIKE